MDLLRCVAFLLLACLVSTQPVPTTLRIGAFNLWVFGRSKMSKANIPECIAETLSRYDVVLVQEIRESNERENNAICRLRDLLNDGLRPRETWKMILSKRLGRTRTKEQYAYFYKHATVKLVDEHQWPNTSNVFERPPYIARFKSTSGSLEFGFIGIHTKWNDTVNEMNNLTAVYDEMSARWGLENFIIGGDLNAGGTYVRKKDWPLLRLRTNTTFLWTTGDDVYTSTNTNSAYDRLVLAGEGLMNRSYVNGSAWAYNYNESQLNCSTLATNISDHYPIELLLREHDNARRSVRQVSQTLLRYTRQTQDMSFWGTQTADEYCPFQPEPVQSASRRQTTILWIAVGFFGTVWHPL